VEEFFIPLTIRLSKKPIGSHQRYLPQVYTQLLQEGLSLVRKQGLRSQFGLPFTMKPPWFDDKPPTTSPNLLKEVPVSVVIDEMIPLFQHLPAMTKIASDCSRSKSSFPSQKSFQRSNNKPWRPLNRIKKFVRRQELESSIHGGREIREDCKAVNEEVVTRDLVPAFVKLLKDSEAEVRTAIASQILASAVFWTEKLYSMKS